MVHRRSRRSPIESRADAPGKALAALRVIPSKRLGQNFLVKRSVAAHIAAMAALSPDDEIVEIGSGLGILSDELARQPLRRLHLVEMEPVFAAQLESRFRSLRHVNVIQSDFLELDLPAAIERAPIKVLGNLPFSVAAAILHRLCMWRELISTMVLMFQREVAERIRAKPNTTNYGALSAYSALHWIITSHFIVEAGSFHPMPKVDAEVLVLKPRTDVLCEPPFVPVVERMIRAGFSSRRKTLRNALCSGLGAPMHLVEETIRNASIEPTVRAETLSPSDFVALARAFDMLAG